VLRPLALLLCSLLLESTYAQNVRSPTDAPTPRSAECKVDLHEIKNPTGFIKGLEIGQPKQQVEALLGPDYDLRDEGTHTVVLNRARHVQGLLFFQGGLLAHIRRQVSGLDCGDRFQFMRALAEVISTYSDRFGKAPEVHAYKSDSGLVKESVISLVFSGSLRVEISAVELSPQMPVSGPRLTISISEKHGYFSP
jgi:hypothetical protein